MTKLELQSPGALERLRELAEKSTPGPWAYEFTGEKSNDWCVGQVCGPDGELKSGEFVEGDCVVELVAMAEDARLADARFIAATDPQTVLALISMVEERDAVLRQIALIVRPDGHPLGNDEVYDLAMGILMPHQRTVANG